MNEVGDSNLRRTSTSENDRLYNDRPMSARSTTHVLVVTCPLGTQNTHYLYCTVRAPALSRMSIRARFVRTSSSTQAQLAFATHHSRRTVRAGL
jgi:hypothetical protein